MDSEADQASEDHVILGKRRRATGSHDSTSSRSDTEANIGHHAASRPAESGRKRFRPSPIEPAKKNGPKAFRPYSATMSLDRLPVEILQHLCLFLDPFNLGRLIRVNRTFHRLLNPRKPRPSASGLCKGLPLLSQHMIWSLSRQVFLGDLPSPYGGLSEYEMLQLMLGSNCQYCGRYPGQRALQVKKSQWNSGPGLDGVRTVWPFKVRSCSDCLKVRLVKEQDLMLSTTSALLPGLPFACFTPSLHYIASTLYRHGSLPTGLKITKYYFLPQIVELKNEMEQLQAFAPSAYIRWYRGLAPFLADLDSTVSRIEQWDLKHYANDAQETFFPDTSSLSSQSGFSGLHASSNAASNLISTNTSAWQYTSSTKKDVFLHQGLVTSTMPFTSQVPHDHGHRSAGKDEQPASRVVPGVSTSNANKNNERTIQEVRRIQAQRRFDIEHRCSLLDPPIPASELVNLGAFNAAVQIVQPLDETAWELLKPRLLKEFSTLRNESLTETDDVSSYFPSRETVVSRDREHQNQPNLNILVRAQRTTKEKVEEIAQGFIKRSYMDGTNVTADTAPRFAADVLDHVNTKFYEIQQQEDAELALQGHAPPGDSQSGMRTRNLQLRHMKHVVDKCISPCTDLIQKDLFLCSGCEPSEKFFPFVGLIQHYASKHTNTFSRGSSNLYWDSPWPKTPPYRKFLAPGNSIRRDQRPVGTPARQLEEHRIDSEGFSSNSSSSLMIEHQPEKETQKIRRSNAFPVSSGMTHDYGQTYDDHQHHITYGAPHSPQSAFHARYRFDSPKPVGSSARIGNSKVASPENDIIPASLHITGTTSNPPIHATISHEPPRRQSVGHPQPTRLNQGAQKTSEGSRHDQQRPLGGHVNQFLDEQMLHGTSDDLYPVHAFISRDMKRTSSEQVDDFLKNFHSEMEPPITTTVSVATSEPSRLTSLREVPFVWPRRAAQHGHISDYPEHGAHLVPYHVPTQQRTVGHHRSRNPVYSPTINSTIYDYEERHRQVHRPQGYEILDSQVLERSLTQPHSTYSDQGFEFPAKSAMHRTMSSQPLPRAPANDHVPFEERFTYAYGPTRRSSPPRRPYYRQASEGHSHYVTVQPNYAPVNDGYAIERSYRREPSYEEGHHPPASSPGTDRYTGRHHGWDERQ